MSRNLVSVFFTTKLNIDLVWLGEEVPMKNRENLEAGSDRRKELNMGANVVA